MRIIVGDGKVARGIARQWDIIVPHREIEIRDEPLKLVKVLQNKVRRSMCRVEAVINTAAIIDLERCELQREECYTVNAHGALNLARACDALGWRFVQISSGCVFDGMETDRVFTEEDVPSPASFYAVSKADADSMILNAKLDVPVLILRPRQIISRKPCKTNLLTKFLSLPKDTGFITCQNSITCLEDFGDMVDHLLWTDQVGIFNCANEGTQSPFQIALALTAVKPIDPLPISYSDYLKRTSVKRVNTILSVDKLKRSGYQPNGAKEIVRWCVDGYGK